MNRRAFLGQCIALAAPPAIVRASWLMHGRGVIVRPATFIGGFDLASAGGDMTSFVSSYYDHRLGGFVISHVWADRGTGRLQTEEHGQRFLSDEERLFGVIPTWRA